MTQPNRTAHNIAVVSAASFGQIVIQFFFQRVLASFYGAGAEADALAAALALPTLFAAIVTGSLSYVLVPELVAKFADAASSSYAWSLASFVGALTFLVGLCFALLLFAFSEPLCGWLYSELQPAQIDMTSNLLQILSIQVVFSGLISWAQSIHHSRHSFLIPALGGVVGTGLSLVIAQRYGTVDIRVLAWAIIAGSLASVLVHLVPIAGKLKKPIADSTGLLKLCHLFWPLILGSMFIRIDPLVDRVLASRLSAVDPGAIAYINYSQRILTALLAIGTSGLAVVAFPQLAQRLEGEGQTGFSAHFSLAFRRLILIIVPIGIGFSSFSIWIVRDLLQQGEFTSVDSQMVGYLIVSLMGMFVGASCGELLARGFYVLGDTRTPTVVGALSLVLGLALKLSLFQWIGIWGITSGVSAYFLLSASIMALLLVRRASANVFSGVRSTTLQSLLATTLACMVAYGVYQLPHWGNTWFAAPAGAVAYFLSLLALRNPDATQLAAALRSRVQLPR